MEQESNQPIVPISERDLTDHTLTTQNLLQIGQAYIQTSFQAELLGKKLDNNTEDESTT